MSRIVCNYQVNTNEKDDDDVTDLTKRKVMKITSLYQILYHKGRNEKAALCLLPTVYTKSAKAEKF